MRYIGLSFDDGRSDTYDVAFPILRKYGLLSTVNVISDFVFNYANYRFKSASKAMTEEQIVEWQNVGYEVACHGSTHKNTGDDVRKNIEELKKIGINVSDIGFASPSSEITEENYSTFGIAELRENGSLSYVRSGIQVRREGGYMFCLH